jgi:hypothetical protein
MERSLVRRGSGVQGVQRGKTRESEWKRVRRVGVSGVSACRRVGVSACRPVGVWTCGRVLRRSTIFIAIDVQIA